MKTAFFDTKPYDKELFGKNKKINWQFFECRLSLETAEKAKGIKAVVSFVNCKLDRSCLKKLKEIGVEYVALRSTGFNHIDLQAAHEMDFRVTYVPGYSPYSVAEHAVGLLFCLNRKIHFAYSRVHEQNFSLNGLMGIDLHGKVASVIGAGRIGKATAAIFRGMGMEVLLVDPFEDPSWAGHYVGLQTALQKGDVISLHVPLNEKTRHLINAQMLQQMKREAFLINTSRGAAVETKALIKALQDGKIAGVALDVYEKEAGVFFEDLRGQEWNDSDLKMLLEMPNVLITPHQGFFTKEALSEIADSIVRNLLAFSEGNPPLNGTAL